MLSSISKDASPNNCSNSKPASRPISFIAITLKRPTLVSNTFMLGLASKAIKVRVKGGSLIIDIKGANAVIDKSLSKLAKSSNRALKKKGYKGSLA